MTRVEPLGSLVTVRTGVPFSRVRRVASEADPKDVPDAARADEPGECASVRVLVPAAMAGDGIDDAGLALELVSGVNREFLTREGDIVTKTSTPYNSVFVDAAHSRLLVTSLCLILRPRPESKVDMRYLAAYLSCDRAAQELRSMSKGTGVQLIKKRDLEGMLVPVLPAEAQRRVADAFEQVRALKELCRRFERQSDLLLESELDRLL